MGLVRASWKKRLLHEKSNVFLNSRKNISLNARTPNQTLHSEPISEKSDRTKSTFQIVFPFFNHQEFNNHNSL